MKTQSFSRRRAEQLLREMHILVASKQITPAELDKRRQEWQRLEDQARSEEVGVRTPSRWKEKS